MKRLHKLVILSFLGPFVMTFFIVLFLLLMQFLWRYIDELVGKGLGIEIIGEFLMYASAGLVPLALPLAVLLSALMTFGNMGEYYELTAIKASGVSLQRVMLPVIGLVILISGAAFFFANNVVPITNLKMRTLRMDVKNLNPEVSITEGVFNKRIENFIIRVNKKDPVKGMLYGIKIYDHSGPRGNPDVTIADSGRIKMTEDKRNIIITLWDGYKYTETEESRRKKNRRFPHRLLKFKEQNIIIAMSGFELSRSDERIFKSSYQMLDVMQLKHATDSLKREMYTHSREFTRTMINNSFFKLNNSTLVNTPGVNTQPYPNRRLLTTELQDKSMLPEEARKIAIGEAVKKPRKDLQNISALVKDTNEVDSLPFILPKLRKINGFDSLIASFDLDDQLKFVSSATANVSSNQYLVFGSTQRMDFETRQLRKHEIELHRKFTLSFACLIFLFIGAPLGAIIRKGGLGLPTVISTLLFILYYIISLIGQKFVEESVLTPFQGMWLSSFVLIIAGIFLTYQATNDSAILNIDTYLSWIREKTGLKRGKLMEQKTHIYGRFELIDIPRAELQSQFRTISDQASTTLESLERDCGWVALAKKSFENKGIFYLLEFGIHYNSFIDQVILSKWYRIPYFEKRILEFPFINGRITSTLFAWKYARWLALMIFPVALVRLIHLKIKVYRLQQNLKQVINLSAGMVNLLNSSAIKIDTEIPDEAITGMQ